MKTLVHLILFTVVVLYSSCEKQVGTLNMDENLTGEWEYIKATGGFTGNQIVLPPAGSKTVLTFTTNNGYKKTVSGQLVEQGFYKVLKVKSIFSGDSVHAIKFNDASTLSGGIISIKNDSLWITDNHVEPFKYHYFRIK